jgi:hypothetical protein
MLKVKVWWCFRGSRLCSLQCAELAGSWRGALHVPACPSIASCSQRPCQRPLSPTSVTVWLCTGADLTNTNFEDALVGSQDANKLCANPTLVGESRDQVGCKQ